MGDRATARTSPSVPAVSRKVSNPLAVRKALAWEPLHLQRVKRRRATDPRKRFPTLEPLPWLFEPRLTHASGLISHAPAEVANYWCGTRWRRRSRMAVCWVVGRLPRTLVCIDTKPVLPLEDADGMHRLGRMVWGAGFANGALLRWQPPARVPPSATERPEGAPQHEKTRPC
jgi:hypothetical protein